VGDTVQLLLWRAGTAQTLAASTANDGAFDWLVPANQAAGTNYRIEVRSIASPAVADLGDGDFTILPATPTASITLVSPNGGETFARGTAVPIVWNSSGDLGSTVKIVLRRGTASSTLFGGTPNDGSHVWNIPATYPTGSNFSIEISSNATPAITDATDANFTIADTTPEPAIAVTSPNGGEAYLQGDVLPIAWTATGNTGTSVEILAHGGGQTFSVAPATANDNAFNWTIPMGQPPATNYTIEVRSISAPTAVDTSNGAFAIHARPTLTVTAPNGGETFQTGAVLPIAWTTTGDTGSNVEILIHRGGQSTAIATSTANDGAFNWTIPANQTIANDFVIEVRSLSAPSVGDSSDGIFAIEAATPTDTITVLAPNGGETLLRGSAVEIRWNSTGNVGSTVKIVLKRGTYSSTLFGGTPNDGTHTWTIPATYPTGEAVIEISSLSNPAIADQSNANFTIAAP